MQEYLKKYSEWSSDPKRPDIRMQYKPTDAPLNQNSEEIRTIITNTITRLKKTSSGEDVTLKINGEEQYLYRRNSKKAADVFCRRQNAGNRAENGGVK